MKFEYSDVPRTISVYNFAADNHEFIGVGNAHIAPWTGLPRFATVIAPGEKREGYAQVFNTETDVWIELPDHRGKTAYRKEDRAEVTIFNLGELSDEFTFQAPTSVYDVWTQGEWIKDEAAERNDLIAAAESKKSSLLNTVTIQIDTLQDMKEFGMASDEDLAKLDGLRKYRILLNKVDTAEKDIVWPEI